jgi:hypothetical protein
MWAGLPNQVTFSHFTGVLLNRRTAGPIDRKRRNPFPEDQNLDLRQVVLQGGCEGHPVLQDLDRMARVLVSETYSRPPR